MVKAARIVRSASMDTFDDILNTGVLGEMSVKALGLVEGTPDQTVKELLKIGVDDGTYPYPDRNLIAPRITDLCNEGVIYRPYKRKCTTTSRTTEVAVHRIAPIEWREQRKRLLQYSRGPVVLHRLEIDSKTKDSTLHTALWWSDGSLSCSCSTEYHRPAQHRCHHLKGLYKAVTGKEMAGPDDFDVEDPDDAINNFERF